MKLAASQALYAHWSSLCNGRRAPERHDLDPAALRGVLAYTFMLDVKPSASGHHDAEIRLSGTRLDALFGRDLKGDRFETLWASADRSAACDVLSSTLDDVMPTLIGGGAAPDGYALVPFEMLLLPLRHNGRTHSRLLGSFVPSAMPSWIGLRALDAVALSGWRTLDRSESEAAVSQHAASDDGSARYGHLVVHQGGRAHEAALERSSQALVKTGMRRLFGQSLSTRRL